MLRATALGALGRQVLRNFAKGQHFLHAFRVVAALQQHQRPVVEVDIQLAHLRQGEHRLLPQTLQSVGRLEALDEIVWLVIEPAHR